MEKMKVLNERVVKRWDSVMSSIACEYLMVTGRLSELSKDPQYYNITDGVTIAWMKEEARYWLSCYFESGHSRCDDRFENDESYKIWVSETRKLKRFIAFLEKFDVDEIVAVLED